MVCVAVAASAATEYPVKCDKCYLRPLAAVSGLALLLCEVKSQT
jgi:hypothetical protein